MDNKPEEQQPEARKVSSFTTLKDETPDTVTIQVTYAGDVIEFEAKRLSHAEWMRYDREVPHPPKVQSGMGRTGPTYDILDPTYQQGLQDRQVTIGTKRMAACLLVQIEGETNDEKAAWLRNNFAVGFLSAIANQINDLHSEGEATIINRRDSFHRNGSSAVTSNGAVATDA